MTDLNKLLTPLFLSEKEVRKIIELIFFSYREFTLGPDEILNKINFGRAHHRVIYFVGKKKNITIKDLLGILINRLFPLSKSSTLPIVIQFTPT